MTLFQKLRRLDSVDRSLVVEALMTFVVVRAGLYLFKFPTLRASLARRPASFPCSVSRITASFAAAARRLPCSSCLPEALTVHTMLRRHGHAPVLRLGVREGVGFVAHAWVECDGEVVFGVVEQLADYAVLS